jgi:hypothetical protein
MGKEEFWRIFLVVLDTERRLGKTPLEGLADRVKSLAEETLALTQKVMAELKENPTD